MPPKDEEDYQPPSYSDKGKIVFRILGPCDTQVYLYEIEVLSYDGCAFWINEGTGCDYWLNQWLDKDMAEGTYVVENIYGTYHRGTFGFDDDWEDWTNDPVRPATQQEIGDAS